MNELPMDEVYRKPWSVPLSDLQECYIDLERKYIGYPVFAKYLLLDDDFFVIRRFDRLHCRVLITLQDEIAMLEEELDVLDARFARLGIITDFNVLLLAVLTSATLATPFEILAVAAGQVVPYFLKPSQRSTDRMSTGTRLSWWYSCKLATSASYLITLKGGSRGRISDSTGALSPRPSSLPASSKNSQPPRLKCRVKYI